MSPEDASTVQQCAEAMGRRVVCKPLDIPAVAARLGALIHTTIPRVIVVLCGNRFSDYRAAMAYLQALGVRDEA